MLMPQQRRSASRVHAICELVIAGFRKLATNELTTANILDGSKVTRTSFYRYFSSIEDAVAYIVKERYDMFLDNLPKTEVLRDIIELVEFTFSELPEFMIQYVEHNSDVGVVGNFSTTAVINDVDNYMRTKFGLSPDQDMLSMLVREAMRGKVHANLM